MMPIMPMDPVSRVAMVAQAMAATTASQSMEPGPSGDAGFAMPSEGAAEVMPVPPSTSTAGGTSVSMAPSAAEVTVGSHAAVGTSAQVRSDAPDTVSEGNQSDASQTAGRERPRDINTDNNAPTLQPSLFTNAVDGIQRHRVEREEKSKRQRARKPEADWGEEDEAAPMPQPEEPWRDDKAGATPRRPMDMATLKPFLMRHAGGLAWSELQHGRRVIVLDIDDAHEGRVRGALLRRDTQGQHAVMPFHGHTEKGWGLAWHQLARQHWRLHRDITPGGKPILTSGRDQAIKPLRICLQASHAADPQDGDADLYMTIHPADPLRLQRHLGRQWTYLVLLHRLDHEPDPAL